MSDIIERLDAFRSDYGTIHEWREMLDMHYDHLRAELLRLQEERDGEAAIALGYKKEAFKLLQQRDALLEALKRIDERACNSLGEDDQPDYGDLLTHMQGIRAETFATFASVEGKEVRG